MIHLDLSDEERDTLLDALESFLSDLRVEIAGTERQAYRKPLKEHEVVIRHVIEQLKGQKPS